MDKLTDWLIPLNAAESRRSFRVMLGLSLLIFICLAWLSVARLNGYNMGGFDLGNMSQAIWSVSAGRPLVFTTEGFAWSRLAFHVELFYLLLAPLYALWPAPSLLLIIQAALVATGAIPVYRLALRHLDNGRAALLLAVIYLLFPVAQTAALFHFHGDTLAMPFLLFALDNLDRRHSLRYAFWLLLALSCKFYIAAPVAALGFVGWWQGQRRLGLATIALGVTWGIVTFFLLRPLFAPAGETSAATSSGYLSYYFGQFELIRQTALPRLVHGIIALGPVILLAWRAPIWLLPAGATILPTLLSVGPGPAYDYRFHHYALAVPFLMAAAIYGTAAMRQRQEPWRGRLALSLLLLLFFHAALVDTPLNPFFYTTRPGSGQGLDETGYRQTARDSFKDTWLQRIPPDAPLIANDPLGLRLVNRPTLYRTTPQFKTLADLLPQVDYVVLDALNDYMRAAGGEIYEQGVASDHPLAAQLLADSSFHLQSATQDGLLLFGRSGPGLAQQIQPVAGQADLNSAASLNEHIGLLSAEVEPLGNGRYRLICEWVALQPAAGDLSLIAVSRLDGVAHSRIVHLPTLALLPLPDWPPGQPVRETVEFTIPPDTPPGRYPLLTGWYDTTNLFAAHTDERSRLGDEVQLGVIELP